MSQWFLSHPGTERQPSTDRPAARIVCFAHAGGNPRSFLGWQPALAGEAELIAVVPPHPPGGRLRLTEYIDGAALAIRQAAVEDGRPIYLFGHSLGALVAFEVCRRLRDEPALAHLIVSALAAPKLLPSPRVLELAGLEGEEFAEALVFFGGLPAEILAEKDLLEVLLPGVQADFVLAAQYRYRPDLPLNIAVTVITGEADPHIGKAQVEPWREEFSCQPDIRWVPGGHFYFEDDPSLITGLLREVVLADQHVELI
jgi:surfactin synthase thioesterase subunit